jgi:hypothetical protein
MMSSDGSSESPSNVRNTTVILHTCTGAKLQACDPAAIVWVPTAFAA